MSQAKKRTRSANAFLQGMQHAQAERVEPEDGEASGPPEVVGAWAVAARKGLRERMEEVEEEAKKANVIWRQGILDGQVPVQIPTEKIHDVVGTDRIVERDDGDDADSFRSLVKNIQNRGQRVPIRVRPLDPDWRPHEATPRDITGQEFALQSGRRRLAACRELGIDVLCFLSFADEEQAELEDLQERFYENAVRKDLTQIERLYSIGLIAQKTPGASQAQIAEIMGLSRSTLSRGVGVLKHYDELREMIDLASASRDEIDRALKSLRGNNRSSHPEAVRSAERRVELPPLPFRRKETARGTMSLKRTKEGATVIRIEAKHLEDELLAELVRVLETQ